MMNEFDLFEQALHKYENNITTPMHNHSKICKHTDTVSENGITSCLDCGEQLIKDITHNQEWRFYGHYDSKRSSDPNRVQARKTEERSILKDVENMGFSDTIINAANILYNAVTKGQIFRGESRKAVVFACVYHAYKMSGKCQTPQHLMEVFGLSKKNSLKGLKIVNVNAPKHSPIHANVLTAVHHIHDIMDKFSASDCQKKEVTVLYGVIKNRSSKLNRARPQSVAAALTYYWICKKKVNICLKKFAEAIDLSELTIIKNAKEVALVLRDTDIFNK